jgi:tetratricopeptide (TPR) repeat protein
MSTCARSICLVAILGLLAQVPRAEAQARAGSLRVITGRPGSVIFINGVRHGVTNRAGAFELAKIKAGSYRIRSAAFADWVGLATIAPGRTSTLKISQRQTDDQALLSYQRGDQLRDQSKHEEAIAEYERALRLRPNFPEARIALARSLVALQRFDQAEEHILSAIGDRRVAAEARTVLANMRRSQGLIEEAIAEYERALRLARGVWPEAHIGLALALEIQQDMDAEPILRPGGCRQDRPSQRSL